MAVYLLLHFPGPVYQVLNRLSPFFFIKRWPPTGPGHIADDVHAHQHFVDQVLIFAVSCCSHFAPELDMEELAQRRCDLVRHASEQAAKKRIAHLVKFGQRAWLQLLSTSFP